MSKRWSNMNQKLYTALMAVIVLAIIACSDNVAGSSENPNTVTAKNNLSSSSDVEISSSAIIESSSSIKTLSSSSEKAFLCKVSGEWGDAGSCVRILPSGKGDLWSLGDRKVKTDAFAKDSSKFGDRAGELFFEIDSTEGSKTWVSWFNTSGRLTEFGNGTLSANLFLSNNESSYVKIGFYVAGFDSNGVALSADISNWNGLCVLYSGTISPIVQLDLGDSLNKKMGYALPSVTMSKDGEPQCFEWNQFKQPNIDKEHEIVSVEETVKHVVRIVFLFQNTPSSLSDVYGAEFIALGTNRDE